MIIFNCKICGEDIEVDIERDLTWVYCEHCYNNVTLPLTNDARLIDLFNGGNMLRMNGEFEKAAKVFEHIINDSAEECEAYNWVAEAHWCLALCRHGILYVQNPKNHMFIPICNRNNGGFMIDDEDYLTAYKILRELGHLSVVNNWEAAANIITDVQKAHLGISDEDNSNDVFVSVFNCKVCGGYMEYTNDGIAVDDCEYCGNQVSLPLQINDQLLIDMFNDANSLRMYEEFDKAATIYERIICERTDVSAEASAEAHWCLALCRHGVVYVKDPATGWYVVSCRRDSSDLMINDPDYLAAFEKCRKTGRLSLSSYYEREAAWITELQEDVATLSSEESGEDAPPPKAPPSNTPTKSSSRS